MLLKQNSLSLPKNLALVTFGELLIAFSTKVNLLYLILYYTWIWKSKIICYKLFKNSNLDDSGISLPVFLSRTNVKLHISVTPKMLKKVITNLDSSKGSGLDCIPAVVLKNCEPDLSYILAELFNMCLKEYYFPECWKLYSMVPVFKNIGERSTAKNYNLVSLLSVVFRAFNRSGATWAVTLDISKAFNRVLHTGILHKLNSYDISGQIFDLIFSFLSNRRLWVVLDGMSSQEYPVKAGVSKGSNLGPKIFLLYINDLPDDVTCSIATYADDTTLNVIRHLICGNN